MKFDSFYTICYAWISVAIFIHILMFIVKAPFGRHASDKWGPMINNKLGWIIMEFPSLAIMLYFLFLSDIRNSFVWILFYLWIFHYINRTFIYPFRIKTKNKKMPIFIVGSAIFFNIMNAGLNGYFLTYLSTPDTYDLEWIKSWNFIIGGLIFTTGIWINWKSDGILISLRRPGETGYKIPKGFLFEYITCPNLFGEIIEWFGFSLMAWNLPALTFAIWTYANLLPRAKNHYDWYIRNFPDYPRERKVLIPFIY